MADIFKDIVEKKHYSFIDGEEVTWQEAVRLSLLPMVADGSVSEDFHEEIIACIEKYGPYMVFDHNVAMPHTTENAKGAYKTGIGFMVSEKMIDFGFDEDGEHKEANLFFTLSSANPDEHTDNIMQLSNVFVNDDLLDALQAARTPEDILAAAEKYPCEE